MHRCSATLAACGENGSGALDVQCVETIAGLQSGRSRRRQSLQRWRHRGLPVPRRQPMASKRTLAKLHIVCRPAVSSHGEQATVQPTMSCYSSPSTIIERIQRVAFESSKSLQAGCQDHSCGQNEGRRQLVTGGVGQRHLDATECGMRDGCWGDRGLVHDVSDPCSYWYGYNTSSRPATTSKAYIELTDHAVRHCWELAAQEAVRPA